MPIRSRRRTGEDGKKNGIDKRVRSLLIYKSAVRRGQREQDLEK